MATEQRNEGNCSEGALPTQPTVPEGLAVNAPPPLTPVPSPVPPIGEAAGGSLPNSSHLPPETTTVGSGPGALGSSPAPEPVLFNAAAKLQAEITQALSGATAAEGVNRDILLSRCLVIDYWLAEDTTNLIERLGLVRLAQEIKKDYVLASFLAWRGEYKLSYITLRSFLESFCLLLYYLNQGCDRLLYLKGKGYKLMLHRMAQKRPDPDDMHAFRRHYHLLIAEGEGNNGAADKFFDEIGECYGILSRAVHGDYAGKSGETPQTGYLVILERVLRVCNTLALYDPILDATDDDLNDALGAVLTPPTFQWRPK